MKSIKLFVFTVCLLAGSVAQAGWMRIYGGSGIDEGHCVQEVEDGYIITGSQTLSSGEVALWLLKTDTLGDESWSKTYRATDSTNAWGNFAQQTSDGGYIVTGVDQQRSDLYRIWLLKANSDGDTLWTRRFYSGFGIGYCVQETNDNGFIISAQKDWFPARFTLIKADNLGDSTWMREYLLSGWVHSSGLFVQQTHDGGYVGSGFISDTLYGSEKYACWVIKIDSDGDTLWTYTIGGENWDDRANGRCVRQTRDENYITTGNLDWHAFLLKIDNSGDSIWTRSYSFNPASSCIEKQSKDEYALTGEVGSFLSFEASTLSDMWLLSTDKEGDSLWSRSYVSGESRYIEETRDKGFIMTGKASGDLFLLKTDSLGLLGIEENPIVEADNGWNVPHSIGSYVVLHYQSLPQGFRANVFDVSGSKVDQIRGDGNEGAMTWGINQPPGVYFIQALDNQNQLKIAKVVLVR